MKMPLRHKATARATTAEPPVLEPAWRKQRPARSRRKVQPPNQPAAGVVVLPARPAFRWHLPAISFRPQRRHWALLPVLAVIVFGAVELFSNDLFFVFEPRVRGNQRVSSAEVIAASGLQGKSIFWIRPREVNTRLHELTGVAAASTHVRLPNQVIVDVQEQVPLVAWNVGDVVVWIDADGEPMPVAGAGPPLSLADATGAAAEPESDLPGEPGPHLRQKLLSDLRVIRTLRPDLTDLYYGATEGLYFRVQEGWTVYLGNQGDIATKLGQLQALRLKLAGEKNKPTVVDLRVDGTAFYH